MSPALAMACVWCVLASVIGMLPSRDHHWRAAYVLIALGVPLLGWIIWRDGVMWALIALAAGGSILRWPLIYLWRWFRRRFG